MPFCFCATGFNVRRGACGRSDHHERQGAHGGREGKGELAHMHTHTRACTHAQTFSLRATQPYTPPSSLQARAKMESAARSQAAAAAASAAASKKSTKNKKGKDKW